MSKLYTNQNAGTSVLTGRIKSIAEDRKSAVIAYNHYDYQQKKSSPKEKKIVMDSPLDATYEEKQTITAVGYIMGPDFKTVCISNRENIYEMEQIAFLSGMVTSARLNEEKNEDGTSKLKSDGNPRKPHFDIQMQIPRTDGSVVHHFVRVYDAPQQNNAQGNIEKYQNRFADFKNPEETPMYVTIATRPGQDFSFQKDDGSVYLGSSHLGINSLDIEYRFQKEKEAAKTQQPQPQPQAQPGQPTPQPQQAPAPVQPQQAPVQQAAPMPSAPQTPAPEVNGFDADYNFDEEFEQ